MVNKRFVVTRLKAMGEFLDRVDVGEIVGRPVSAYADELVAAYY